MQIWDFQSSIYPSFKTMSKKVTTSSGFVYDTLLVVYFLFNLVYARLKNLFLLIIVQSETFPASRSVAYSLSSQKFSHTNYRMNGLVILPLYRHLLPNHPPRAATSSPLIRILTHLIRRISWKEAKEGKLLLLYQDYCLKDTLLATGKVKLDFSTVF